MDKRNHRTISGPQKTGGFLTASGKHCPEEKNHRSRHPRFGGIPKGSPFGDSLPHLSGQSERWAPGGRRRKVRFASGFRRAPSARFLAPPFPSKPTSLGFAGVPISRWAVEKWPSGASLPLCSGKKKTVRAAALTAPVRFRESHIYRYKAPPGPWALWRGASGWRCPSRSPARTLPRR